MTQLHTLLLAMAKAIFRLSTDAELRRLAKKAAFTGFHEDLQAFLVHLLQVVGLPENMRWLLDGSHALELYLKLVGFGSLGPLADGTSVSYVRQCFRDVCLALY